MSNPPPRGRAITIRLPADWVPDVTDPADAADSPCDVAAGVDAPSTRARTQPIAAVTVREVLRELVPPTVREVLRELRQDAAGTQLWICYPGWECHAPGGQQCPCGAWRQGHDHGDEDNNP